MQQMSNPMSCKVLADTHIVLLSHVLDGPANLVQRNSRFADSNGFVKSPLSHLYNFDLYLVVWLSIENS
jgi:hypothetical protein